MAWTSNATTATHSSAILKWYCLANALIGILVLPYMLQYSLGRLRFHVIGNAILSFTLLPTLFYTSLHFGGIGSGVTLLVFRSFFILFWIPVVYHKIAPELNYSWLTQDVLPASAATIATLFIFSHTVSFPQNNLLILLIVGVIFLSALFVGLITGDHSRIEILKCFRMKTINQHQ
jgi:hypothetical protein